MKTEGGVPNLMDYYTEVFSPKGGGGGGGGVVG